MITTRKLQRRIRKLRSRVRLFVEGEDALPGYAADGFRTINKNTGFMDEPRFARAWAFAKQGNEEAWSKRGYVPDVRWRAHTACWAASRALRLDGDFVEFGVNAGLLSMTVCDYLGFEKLDRKFWLFDTYGGIANDSEFSDEQRSHIANVNEGLYQDVFEIATRNFSRFENAILVRGALPGTLSGIPIERIAYLSVDLNVAKYERECIDIVWDRVLTGATVVLDDYAFVGQEEQYAMWNEFAGQNDQLIVTLPTGQGVMIKQ